MKRYIVMLLNTETQEMLSEAIQYVSYEAAYRDARKKAAQIIYRVNPLAKWCIYDSVEKKLVAIKPIGLTLVA